MWKLSFKKDKEKKSINFAAADSVRLPSYLKNYKEYGDDRNNYYLYEYLYKNYVDVAVAIDTIAAYATGAGYEITGDVSDNTKEEIKAFLEKNKFTNLVLNIIKTMLVFGDAYVLIAKDEQGEIFLQVLDPNKVKINIDDYGNIIGYIYSPSGILPGGDNIELPIDAVMHFSYNRLGSSVYGTSILKSIKDLLDTKINLETIAGTMAWRMTHPLIHAKVGDEANPPSLEEIMNVEGLLKNRVRSDGTIANNITTSYTVDIKAIPVNPDLNGLRAVLEHIQAQIDKALKVPKILMGQPEGSNRATSYNQLKGFIIFLEHIRDIIEDEINTKLLADLYPGAKIEFNEVLKEDELVYAEIAVKLYHEGIITINEARAFVGLPPVEEG